jgi:uncharacterized LabA/DUF88 family protein
VAIEPSVKRAMAFFDGQNLFYAAKEAFAYSYPNYDPQKLAGRICLTNNWQLQEIKFYTGLPDPIDKPYWNHFWTAKLAIMGTRGIKTFTRPLRYRNQIIKLADGTTCTAPVGVEKGIDVRIALDVLRLAIEKAYDVALIFSQDQDLSEAADEVRKISQQQQRWIKVACAFPISPTYNNRRGINNTEWIKITRQEYDACLDPNNYRPKNQV